MTRLSRKAQELAAKLAADFGREIRRRASERASMYNQEHANEMDVTAAWQDHLLESADWLKKDRKYT